MGKDDNAWRRFREREDEQDDTPSLRDRRTATTGASVITTPGDSAGVDRLIEKIEPLIEQTNNLYAQYLAGMERLPPIEKRTLLDGLTAQLQTHPKPTPASQFKAQTILTRVQTHRDRWDRLMRDLEEGKIKRPSGRLRG